MTVEDFLKQWHSGCDFIEARTSGSTGTPKPIRLLKTDMVISARNTCRFFGIDSRSSLHLPLPVDYIAGKMMVVRSIVSGASITFEKPSNEILSDYPSSEISLLAIVPSQISSLLKTPLLPNIKNIIIGGGAIPPALESQLVKMDVNAYATYGMTETCSHVALRKVGQSTYKAIEGFTFATDDRGCLTVMSEVMSFKRLQTNDIVRLISPQEFEWKGRYDNVINSGGIKVYPEEIERTLSKVITDREFFITSQPDEKWGESVICVIEGEIPIENIEESYRRLLTPAQRPKRTVFVKELQRTYSGKIIRKLTET